MKQKPRLSRTHRIAITFLLVVGAAPAEAQIVNLPPVKDATLFSNDFNAASGAGPVLFVGDAPSTLGDRRAVLKFDVAGGIPQGSTITVATLTLFVQGAGSGASLNDFHQLHRLLQDWGEAGSDSGTNPLGAPAAPGDATWLHAFHPGPFWNTPGGFFAPQPSAVQPWPTAGLIQISSPQMTADVSQWLGSPGTNHGWLLIGNELTDDTIRSLGSRESSTGAVLTIQFLAPAGAVPNGASVPGQPLRVGKGGTSINPTLDLVWDQGCRIEPDYSVYSGQIGQFYGHGSLQCSTGGATQLLGISVNTSDGEYYIATPIGTNGNEGSHGTDHGLNQRPRGTGVSCPQPHLPAVPICP